MEGSPKLLDQLEFARKDFKHRRFQTLLAFSGLVICVSSTIFLILLGQNLGLTFVTKSASQLSSGLSNVISAFVGFDTILIFAIGMLTIYFLTSSMMANRIRDTGLIKAIGSTGETGRSYIMSGPLLVVISGCLVGGLVGIIAFVTYAWAFLQTSLGQIVTDFFIFSGILFASFVAAWFITGYQIEKAIKATSVNLLAGDIQNFNFEKEQLGSLKDLIERLPFSLKTVLKGMIRSRTKSKTALVCLRRQHSLNHSVLRRRLRRMVHVKNVCRQGFRTKCFRCGKQLSSK